MPASDAASVVIACPHCGTRYQVPYQAIGPKGRTVGCAHCGQSWEAHAERPKAPPRPTPPPPKVEDRPLGELAEEVLDEKFVNEEKRHKAKREASARAEAEAKTAQAKADAELRARAAELVEADIKAEAAARAEAIARATSGIAGAGPAAVAGAPPADHGTADPEAAARAAEHQRTLDEIKAAIAPKPRKGTDAADQLDPAARKRQLQEFSARQRHLYSRLPIARLRRTARLAAALTLALLLGSAIMWRGQIVAQFPQLAGLYAAVGLGVNVVGLEFRDVRTLQALQQGTEVLSVDGSIASASGHEVGVPQVIVTLLGAKGEPLYEWSMVPKATELEPGESIAFETQLTNPPAGAKDVQLSFATARTQSRSFETSAVPAQIGGGAPMPAPAAGNPKFTKPAAGASAAADNPKAH